MSKSPKKKPSKAAQPSPAANPAPAPLSPNHVSQRPRPIRVSYKQARNRLLKRYGHTEDELDALFKTEAELLTYYTEVATRSSSKEVEDELGWDMEDAVDAPVAEKARLDDARKRKQLARYKHANPQAQTGTASPQAGVSPQAQAPKVAGSPSAPLVTPEEFAQAGTDLAALLAEEPPDLT